MKYKKEFKEAHPETIGETDDSFDMSNYIDWIDNKLQTQTERERKLYEALSGMVNNPSQDSYVRAVESLEKYKPNN